MSKRLQGKVALVTGASKGIGAEIAKQFAAEGAAVIVNYASSRSGAERVVEEICGNGGEATAVQADVSKEDDIARLVETTRATYGRLDILVNNAGVYEWNALEEITAEGFHRLFDLNVLGLLLTTKKAAELLPNGGSVVNVSSAVVALSPSTSTVYTATKAAVDAITRTTAKELGPRGIRINSLSPGMVETEGSVSAGFIGSDFEKGVIAQTPLGRIGQPDDIASVATFLASDESKWVTGQVLNVTGGMI